MSKKRIIIVEDDIELAELTSEYLSNYGFETQIFDNGKDAIEAILLTQPALVILDLNLPDTDGFSICRTIRNDYINPILMLTASNEAIDEIVGLELGADDFINKPIEPRILLARVRALLRRAVVPEQLASNHEHELADSEVINIETITINYSKREVFVDGKIATLSVPEYELLLLLAQHAGQILSREDIFKSLKGYEYDGISRFVDILVSQIRPKINDSDAKLIKTVRGKGYLLAI